MKEANEDDNTDNSAINTDGADDTNDGSAASTDESSAIASTDESALTVVTEESVETASTDGSVEDSANEQDNIPRVTFAEPIVVASSESTQEVAPEIETPIIRARKRALSGQQIQAEKLMRNTKQKLNELSVGRNVIIPIPQFDRGPTDHRNIRGVVMEVNEFGYRIGTQAGTLSGYLSRNQFEEVSESSLTSDMVPSAEISLREAVKRLSKTGGQGFLSCKCKGGCKTSKCKCKKSNVLCNSRCHSSMTCSNK